MGFDATIKAAILACLALKATAATTEVDGLTLSAPIDTVPQYQSQIHPCPEACRNDSPANWTVYSEVDRLALCDQPMLLDMAIYSPIDDPSTYSKLRVCTAAGDANTTSNAVFEDIKTSTSTEKKLRYKRAPGCNPTAKSSKESLDFIKTGPSSGNVNDVVAALTQLERRFIEHQDCAEQTIFSYANGAIAGVYIGSFIERLSASAAIKALIDQARIGGSAAMSAQLCGKGRNSNHILGVTVVDNGDIAAAQRTIRGWADAECLQGNNGQLSDLDIVEAADDLQGLANFTRRGDKWYGAGRLLVARADCRTIQVASGDSCGSLASRCGISASDYTKYNPAKDHCSTLQPGQRVCCSSGTMPDYKPKPNSDGSCASYFVQSGDNCSKLAASNGLTLKDIEGFNNGTNGTWGWSGCNNLMAGINICLSTGKPPMPAAVSNAVCGPTKPGSSPPASGKTLADLNPCPLKVCCNIWGQCGINQDFCTEKRGPSGNPGTSPPGTNGCVSNCGMDIVNNKAGPSNYGRIGYYETWNFNRPCLNMRVENANFDGSYSHIHWAFAEISTSDWSVKINDSYEQWSDFKSLNDVKRIVSFGGWGYSTEPGTYDILRQAMSPANRNAFSANVASFLSKEGLDGVDFDWEYPGAIDIPGTPPGQESDGPNYLKFLATMKSKMPSGKTLSIAAPASYWYLKAFPIADMSKYLDYIVYMTYDLHGQWDAGNQWATEGCPSGNCLRSHVNLTETNTALSMITKAGVPSNKIFVGESSYGRSFKMSQAGCTGPMCTFTGDRLNSNAAKGRCTDTAGYISNAEIKEIQITRNGVKSWHDGASNSDIMVYDSTEWVAYMSETTKDTRMEHWKGLNFAGTIDWAVDLRSFEASSDSGPDEGDDWPDPPSGDEGHATCEGSYNTLEDIENDLANIPYKCRNVYTIEVLGKMLKEAMGKYDDLMSDGYDKKFNTYADAVVRSGDDKVDDFMTAHSNDYFSCVVTEAIDCCNKCHYQSGKDSEWCRYCENRDDCGWSSICEAPRSTCGPYKISYKNMTQPCPPDYSMRGQPTNSQNKWLQSVYYTLRDDKANNFWADLYEDTGIDKENIAFETVERYPCVPSDKQCYAHDHDYNFPRPHGYDRDDVVNPKELVDDARGKVSDLPSNIDTVVSQIKSGAFMGSSSDVVEALGLPVSMVVDAVDQMDKISDIVDKWEDEKRKSIIMAFLSALLFFIPVVGEVASAVAGAAAIGRTIALLGTVGNVAFEIYQVVDDPSNAPLAIFSIILEPLALLDIAKMGKAASASRTMSLDDIKKMGDGVGKNMDLVRRIARACRLRKRDFVLNGYPMSSLTGKTIYGM